MVGRGGGKDIGKCNKDGRGGGCLNHAKNGGGNKSYNGVRLGVNNNVVRRTSSLNIACNEGIQNLASGRGMGSSNPILNPQECGGRINNAFHITNDFLNSIDQQSDHESEGFNSPDQNIIEQLGKRKRVTNLVRKVNMVLQTSEIDDPCVRRQYGDDGHLNQVERCRNEIQCQDENAQTRNGPGTAYSAAQRNVQENGEATSKVRKRGDRGRYKSYIVDMKLKGNQSKLKIYIPDYIDRAIGDNARHLVNECGRVVRTRDPLNVKNWSQAFAAVGDSMWKEIEKPPPDLPQDHWDYCVKRFSSREFKEMSERNSKNRRSDKRCKHTTGNLSFAEYESVLEKKNNGVKLTADQYWLAEHTQNNEEGKLQWADMTSKEIHGKLQNVVTTHGDSMTQEQILLEVLEPRSGYFCGKGTALRGFSRSREQLEQQNTIREQQKKIEVQDQQIKELQENQEQTARLLQQQKYEFRLAIDTMRQELLRELSSRGTPN